MSEHPIVSIVMGSDSDLEIMNEAAKALSELGVSYEIDITSAHRSQARTSEYSRGLKARGVKVVIAGAGGAAHLAGVIAAETLLQRITSPASARFPDSIIVKPTLAVRGSSAAARRLA